VTTQDIWTRWLLERRFGGDHEVMESVLRDHLYPWRDAILDHAALEEGEVLLDVGCGDGLVAFGALERTRTGMVIFSDISTDLLDITHLLAAEMGVLERCRFVQASADDLSAIETASVDVVTTRSLLIYVKDKQNCFDEFSRVLRPGGRISLFEPINRFGYPEPPDRFDGYDVGPVPEIADKLKTLYERLQPFGSDPMVDFDERDLVDFAERAGFGEIHMELKVRIAPPEPAVPWETFLNTAGNPKIPTLAEAMQQVLTPQEIERFTAHLRPLVEDGRAMQRRALAFLWAKKRTEQE
jgi:ubiquinone/menaquinone biosynthesis C-methylase UbiE